MRRELTVNFRLGALMFAMALFGFSPLTYSATGSIPLGRFVAEAYCSPCHAIGPTGRSPHAPAPPFRTLHEKYSLETFAERFANGIAVGRPGAHRMPELQLSAAQMENLIAYLKSLEPARPVTTPRRDAQRSLDSKPR
jgi:cytochrome c